jgi:hypothetical protein
VTVFVGLCVAGVSVFGFVRVRFAEDAVAVGATPGTHWVARVIEAGGEKDRTEPDDEEPRGEAHPQVERFG